MLGEWSGEWLDQIEATLDASLATKEQRIRALKAAEDLVANLPSGSPKADHWADYLKRLFGIWVDHMLYLRQPEYVDHYLPESVLRSKAEVATYYGLKTSKAVGEKQAQLADWAECRIERCVTHLRAGWDEDMCVIFVCSREEWRQAVEQAGRVAA